MRLSEIKRKTPVTESTDDMLDISIINVDKAVQNTKKAVVPEKVKELLSKEFTATQKHDGCLDYNTKIITQEFGEIEIGKVVDENLECSVLSYNHKTCENEYKPVLAKKNSGKANNWVKITLENGSTLTITDNHWVWSETRKDYVQVKDMVPGEEVIWKK